jgi:protein-S-isoprenylcysteine O-methyltransferase Ste14
MYIFFDASGLSLLIGFVVALVGESIRFWGVSWAGSETRTTSGVGSSYLVISGPFAHVRNPLYIGNILMYVGLGIMSFSLFPYLQIVALFFFLFQYYLIVGEEEEFLAKKYGPDYEEFKKNVPAFLPRITPYKNEKIAQPQVNFKKGLKSETRTLQAFLLISLSMLVIWLIKNNMI